MQSNLIRGKISCLFFAPQRGGNFDIGYVFYITIRPPHSCAAGGCYHSCVGLMRLRAFPAGASQEISR